MNDREQARSVFGNTETKDTLKDLSSDMWKPISADRPYSEPPHKRQVQPNRQPQPERPADKKTQAPKKEARTPYVSSKTGKVKKKAPEKQTRISASHKKEEVKKQPKKKPPQRSSAQSQRPKQAPQRPPQRPTAQVQQPKRPPEPERPYNLTKRDKKAIAAQNKIFEQGRRQGKSKDEIRRELQQKKYKKRKRAMFYSFLAFMLILLSFIASYVYHAGALVNNINVEGNSTYSIKKVVASSGIEEGDKLFAIREKEINRILTKNLPYLKSVEVSYKLPDTVVLTVSPTEDRLLIANKNKYLRLDENGKVLSLSKSKLKNGLYKVEGLSYKALEVGGTYSPAEKEKDKYSAAQNLASILKRSGLKSGVINVSDLKNLTFVFENRIKVYFGDEKDLEEKASLASKTIAAAASEGQTGYVDMRFSDRGYFSEGSMDNS